MFQGGVQIQIFQRIQKSFLDYHCEQILRTWRGVSCCSKLMGHMAPGTHNSAVGCTIFGTVRLKCASLFSLLQ